MSDFIQLLPDAIANQIAAGEVVQRPASVVKELMENAVDAGASRIQLIVKDAGKTLIQIVDDGCGMSETDARMAFERHATSKISQASDLFSIRSMGFRGEALASIAAVAQVELRSRRANTDIGTLIKIEGSQLKAHEACQQEPGTSIAVKNLFFNVPARRSFLKSDAVEKRHIVDEFQRIALAQPQIFFSLHYNDNELFHLPEANLRQRIVGLFHQHVNKKLVPVEEGTDVIRLRGYVGKPEFARKTRGEQFFFVNNRFIKSPYLHHAVTKAYDKLLPEGAHPLYIIFIDIDPTRIDINVHPTKQEIKFEDERMVYQVLRVAVKFALGQHNISPSLDFESDVNLDMRLQQQSPSPSAGTPPTTDRKTDNWGRINKPSKPKSIKGWEDLYAHLQQQPPAEPEPTQEESAGILTISSRMSEEETGGQPTEEEVLPVHQSLIQLHQRFIISPIASGILLVDQQAAHERILYEHNLANLNNKVKHTQQKLFPTTIELSAADADILRTLLTDINALGFDLQEFGQQSFILHGTPADFAEGQEEQSLIEHFIDSFKQEVSPESDNTEKLALIMAKTAAIKTGKRLEQQEMQSLIDRLFACQQPAYSPDGRKCFVTMGLEQVEDMFQ